MVLYKNGSQQSKLNVRHDHGRQTATEKKVATATEYCPKIDKRDGKAWQSKHGMIEQA